MKIVGMLLLTFLLSFGPPPTLETQVDKLGDDKRCEIVISDIRPPSSYKGCQAISYKGQIFVGSAKAIGSILAIAEPSIFKLTSSGGRSDGAIYLGEILEIHGIKLVIEDYCISACAHFLALSLNISEVDPNAIVAFHHTWTSMSLMVSRDPDARVRRFFSTIGKMEQNYYWHEKIDLRMLLMPHLQLGLVCYEPYYVGTQLVDVRFRSTYTLWAAGNTSVLGSTWWPKGFQTQSLEKTLENVVRIMVPEERPKVFVQTSDIFPPEWTYRRFASALAETKRCQ